MPNTECLTYETLGLARVSRDKKLQSIVETNKAEEKLRRE